MTPRKARRIRLIALGIGVIFVSAVLIGYGFRGSIEYFKSPTQVVEEGASGGRFRIGGLVEENSLKQDGENISFIITDGGNSITVNYAGLLPDLFSEGQGTIARGEMINDVFVADEILAKHDEEYMPREVIDALKEQGFYQATE